jgi:hypothetical protein
VRSDAGRSRGEDIDAGALLHLPRDGDAGWRADGVGAAGERTQREDSGGSGATRTGGFFSLNRNERGSPVAAETVVAQVQLNERGQSREVLTAMAVGCRVDGPTFRTDCA